MPDDDGEDYEVGYGKPPKHSRFEKGKSGNPSGKPKGSKNTSMAVQRVLNRKVQVTIEGKRKKVPLSEAVAMSMSQKALAGDHRAGVALLRLSASLIDVETEIEKLADIEITAEQRIAIIEMIDFMQIAEGLEDLGYIVRTENGRPKLALSMLDTTLNQAMAARPEGARSYRSYYLEGTPFQSEDDHAKAYRRIGEAQRKRRALKRFVKG